MGRVGSCEAGCDAGFEGGCEAGLDATCDVGCDDAVGNCTRGALGTLTGVGVTGDDDIDLECGLESEFFRGAGGAAVFGGVL